LDALNIVPSIPQWDHLDREGDRFRGEGLAEAAADRAFAFPPEPPSVPRSTVRLRFKAAMRSITFCRDGAAASSVTGISDCFSLSFSTRTVR
jgi:hypothetical protein